MKSFFVRIGLAFKNMVAELKKVTWPSRKELTNYSVVVIVFLVLLAVIVGLLDLGGSSLIKLLMGT
ncbi:MAG: preprotein translocase subunit SecE [Oscillospiraceae bacterium]|nr:preprotein translocase subunit SecE [Oscillospiraceae bacterium]